MAWAQHPVHSPTYSSRHSLDARFHSEKLGACSSSRNAPLNSEQWLLFLAMQYSRLKFAELKMHTSLGVRCTRYG